MVLASTLCSRIYVWERNPFVEMIGYCIASVGRKIFRRVGAADGYRSSHSLKQWRSKLWIYTTAKLMSRLSRLSSNQEKEKKILQFLSIFPDLCLATVVTWNSFGFLCFLSYGS